MNKIYITQIKSSIGILPKHKATLNGLGLKKIGHTVLRKDTESIRGMINLISYMIKIGK
ncbi:50S ribosomal protein L30 [Candidatus Annandia pinicola]|uniref:50S ribosomal protein L30 n=1 Tax=Candidatus Annandia pinicola TaxID=1345117 RepID=UPI001D0263EA|nr:50S ribosomal protein L30 [Candidatus Annandia pinicola]UDG80483.1 50S ribosomal protein L30 [Candidatus Annandia pinicola]